MLVSIFNKEKALLRTLRNSCWFVDSSTPQSGGEQHGGGQQQVAEYAEDDHQADEDNLHVELGLVRVEEPAHAARRVVSILVKVTIVEGEPPWPEITSTDVRRKHFEIDTMLSILFSQVIFVFVMLFLIITVSIEC